MGRLNVKFPQGKPGGFTAYCGRPRGQSNPLALPFLGAGVVVFTLTRSAGEAEPTFCNVLARASGWCAPRNGEANPLESATFCDFRRSCMECVE